MNVWPARMRAWRKFIHLSCQGLPCYAESSRNKFCSFANQMAQKAIASYVRTHRKKSGLTQVEIAKLLGHRNSGRVSRHERGITLPSLSVALGYEAIFRVPVAELFPSVHEAVVKNLEARFTHLESCLGKKSAAGRDANATARKLQYIWARKNGVEI